MNNKSGCLVIHGFGGDVSEVAPLSACLVQSGYRVICPNLKGHGGDRKDLKGVRYMHWISSAEDALLELMQDCDVIYVIGFSMGGLIALNLALRYDLGGIVTINTPVYYWDFKRILANIAHDLIVRDYKNIKRYMKSSISFPVSALVNFRMLLHKTKPSIMQVRCPIFVAQGLDDDTVRKNSADYIFNNVKSVQKQLKFYNNSGHLMLWSAAAHQVMTDIENWIG